VSGELRPNQDELLDIARNTFVEEILPILPADKRLTGLMIANALGVAQRMLRRPPLDEPDAALLCTEIRQGRHDDDDAGELRAHLITRTLARLAVSSPKALPEMERSLGGIGKS
jgi:hypothetical protein